MSCDYFSEDLFRDPPKEYYSVPFWAWNGKLEIEALKKQIDVAEEMGYGGFIMHPRIGLQTPYLQDEYMNAVRFCQKYSAEKGMQAWLYDEDKWPSGFGGGAVTKYKEFRARYLLMTPILYPEDRCHTTLNTGTRIAADGELTLIAKYSLSIENGLLKEYHRIMEAEHEEQSQIWYAYKVVLDDQPWFNNQAYVDVMNPKATECFLQETYEKYYSAFDGKFPENVPAIFTDEPQLFTWQCLSDGNEACEGGIAYTESILKLFREKYSLKLADVIPELFWNRADGKPSEVRYHYCRELADLFENSFAGTIGKWCRSHGILFTGHLMDEATLRGQSRTSADLMRSYRQYDLPGIDILDNRIEHTTAKQAQSICRQLGKQGMICEMYGVTNWDFSFREKKFQGDWLAAMGVNYRIPHLMWLYMGGESKRDYPAPLDQHSPWYRKNGILEDYYARLATILRRGKSVVRIAVLQSVESYWLVCGAEKQSTKDRELLESSYFELSEYLLQSGFDYDYLNEDILASDLVSVKKGQLHVGEMAYDVILLPKVLTLRNTTIEKLECFVTSGGCILAQDEAPKCVEGRLSDRAANLYSNVVVFHEMPEVLPLLEIVRDVLFLDSSGNRIRSLCYQMREFEGRRWVFIAHAQKCDLSYSGALFCFTGEWSVELYDAMSGKIAPAPCTVKNGVTIVTSDFLQDDSLVFCLKSLNQIYRKMIDMPVPYTLEEKNCLVLDKMSFSLDNGEWNPEEELLRVDNWVRRKLGFRLRTEAFPQPWLTIKEGRQTKNHVLHLRTNVISNIEIGHAELVWEGEDDVCIKWNDSEIAHGREWYVDECLHKVQLPGIKRGENSLSITIPYDENTNLEWFYILGEFGVEPFGIRFALCALPDTILPGDYSSQGLPFYGGNLRYDIPIRIPSGRLEIEIPDFKAPLIGISVDGREEKTVFMRPYKADLGYFEEGNHILHICSYGSRINTFGQLHNCSKEHEYYGPKSWRTEGARWSADYTIRPCGVYGPISLNVYNSSIN